jgi:hypothetical protein
MPAILLLFAGIADSNSEQCTVPCHVTHDQHARIQPSAARHRPQIIAHSAHLRLLNKGCIILYVGNSDLQVYLLRVTQCCYS